MKKGGKVVPKCSKCSKKVKTGPKMFNMVLNGLQWSQIVLNGLKKINHKFNRMAFITRFILVLVCSNIVQFLFSKKSTQWILHININILPNLIMLMDTIPNIYLGSRKSKTGNKKYIVYFTICQKRRDNNMMTAT